MWLGLYQSNEIGRWVKVRPVFYIICCYRLARCDDIYLFIVLTDTYDIRIKQANLIISCLSSLWFHHPIIKSTKEPVKRTQWSKRTQVTKLLLWCPCVVLLFVCLFTLSFLLKTILGFQWMNDLLVKKGSDKVRRCHEIITNRVFSKLELQFFLGMFFDCYLS